LTATLQRPAQAPAATAMFVSIVEARRNWINAAALLVRSLRGNGGAFAGAPVRFLLPTVAKKGAETREGLGITVARSRPHPVIPYLNKLEMLKGDYHQAVSHVVLLDYDMVVMNLDGFGNQLDDAVQARRKFKRHLRRVIQPDYDEPLVWPGVRGWSRIDYVNTGVVLVPGALAEPVGRLWEEWAERLMDPYMLHPLVDQVGFSMALAEGRFPYRPLPARFNMTPGIGANRAGASLFHYSSSDPLNRHVRDVVMHSMDYFARFLRTTDSPTWTPFAARVHDLLDDDFTAIRSFLHEAVEEVGDVTVPA